MSHDVHQEEAPEHLLHATKVSYFVGFVLSIILTLIPFWMVSTSAMSHEALYIWLAVFAIVQLFIQLIFFLHVNFHPAGRWNLAAFIFAVIVVVVLVIGTLWIMYNLNYYMG